MKEKQTMEPSREISCSAASRCGGCCYQGLSYRKQLAQKQKQADKLLGKFGRVEPVTGMKEPLYYRNKVHSVFGRDKKGQIICGTYEENSHRIVTVEECLIEDQKSQQIIRTVRDLLPSFRIRVYDEDLGTGLLRHVLVRRGFTTGEIMVVLVTASPVFPSKNNFVKALRSACHGITTIVQNINSRRTSMVLGDRNVVLYGKGFIRDELCGHVFRISPASFYQVNPVQTEVLYRTAVSFAGLSGKEEVLDAYCGIGTIGITAAGKAAHVTGIELNPDAVRDAVTNAKENGIRNICFRRGDAGEYLQRIASDGKKPDVIFMDPPRSGSTKAFLSAACSIRPSRIVYISCNPETLARDLTYLTGHGYSVGKIQPVDMFPYTGSLETVCLLSNTQK